MTDLHPLSAAIGASLAAGAAPEAANDTEPVAVEITSLVELVDAAFDAFELERARPDLEGGDRVAFANVVGPLLEQQLDTAAMLVDMAEATWTEEHVVKAAQRVCELGGKKWWSIGPQVRDMLLHTQREAFTAAFGTMAAPQGPDAETPP